VVRVIVGAPRKDAQLLEISQRAFTRLLMLYPREYRQEYGPQMAQLFKDCSREAVGQSGAAALLTLWTATLLDLFKTAFEEHLKELTHMSKEKFTRLGGWALIAGAVLLLPLMGLGDIETLMGGLGVYLKAGLAAGTMLLLATGVLALRNALGNEGGTSGKGALSFSVAMTVIAAFGGIGMGLGIPGDIWWTLFFFGLVLHLLGIGIFGVLCMQRRTLPRLNWLLAAGGLALPILTIYSLVLQFTGHPDYYPGAAFLMPLVLTLLAYFAAGIQLLRASALKARVAR
jgi:hypothetical protein